MNLVQKDLEEKLIEAFQSVLSANQLADSCRVTGSWQPVAAGLVKWIDDENDRPAIINVAIGTPGRQTYSDPRNDMGGKVTLFLRHEKDPTGELLVSIAAAVQAALDSWQSEAYQQAFTRFDISYFSVGDLTIGQGSSPAFNGDKVAVEWPITLSGSFETTTQN